MGVAGGDYACKPPPWTREGLWEPEMATASIIHPHISTTPKLLCLGVCCCERGGLQGSWGDTESSQR